MKRANSRFEGIHPKDQLLLHDGITMSVRRRQHFPERLVRLLITLCGSIGTVTCLQGFFQFPIYLNQLLLFIVVLTLVMRGIRMLSPKIGFGFILTAFAAIPVLLLKYREQAVAGAGSVYHTMRRHILWKAVFPTTQEYAAGGWTQQDCTQFVFILIAMALVALLEYSDVLMTHTQSSRSGFWIRFLVTFPFLECGLYFGIHTSMLSVFLLVLFWIGTLAVSRRKPSYRFFSAQGTSAPLQQAFLNETEHRFTTHETGAALLLSACAVLAFGAMLSGSHYDPDSEKTKERLETRQEMREAYRNFSIRDVTGLLQRIPTTMGLNVVSDEVDLLRDSDLHFDGKTVLHASVDISAPKDDYYLRGLVRSEYTGRGWAIPNGIYRRNQKLFRRLTDANRMPQTWTHSDHADELRRSDGKFPIANFSMKALNEESVNYLPYQALFKKGTRYRYDIETQLGSYQDYEFWLLTNCPMNIADAAERSSPSSDPLISEYESFVDETYTSLPDSPAIHRIYDAFQANMPDASLPLPERLEAIRDFIWERAEYTQQPGDQPQDADYIEYFLTQSHKGYCAHYASSAVVLCRMCGIPARYAQGYVLTSNGFNDSNRQPETYEIDIPDHQAHAWAEIYIKGFGWIPYEFTETVLETWHRASETIVTETAAPTPAETTAELTDTTTVLTTTTVSSAKTTSTVHTAESTPDTKPEPESRGFTVLKQILLVLGKILLILLLIAAVLYGYYRLHCMLVQRRHSAMHSENPTEAAHASYTFLMTLLRMTGIEQRRMSHDTFAAYADEKCKLLPKGEITQAITLQQAAVFSRSGILAEDAAKIAVTAEKLAKNAYQQSGFLQKLWMRWIRHLVK